MPYQATFSNSNSAIKNKIGSFTPPNIIITTKFKELANHRPFPHEQHDRSFSFGKDKLIMASPQAQAQTNRTGLTFIKGPGYEHPILKEKRTKSNHTRGHSPKHVHFADQISQEIIVEHRINQNWNEGLNYDAYDNNKEQQKKFINLLQKNWEKFNKVYELKDSLDSNAKPVAPQTNKFFNENLQTRSTSNSNRPDEIMEAPFVESLLEEVPIHQIQHSPQQQRQQFPQKEQRSSSFDIYIQEPDLLEKQPQMRNNSQQQIKTNILHRQVFFVLYKDQWTKIEIDMQSFPSKWSCRKLADIIFEMYMEKNNIEDPYNRKHAYMLTLLKYNPSTFKEEKIAIPLEETLGALRSKIEPNYSLDYFWLKVVI